jgi:uncharacterized protein (TIGR02246 family)
MNAFRNAGVLVACTLVTACTAAAPAADTAADSAAIAAVNEAWGKAYNAADAAGLAALYTTDAAVNPPGAPQVRGHAAIQEFFAKDTAGAKAAGVTMALNPQRDSGVSGDLAWESGTFSARDKAGATVDEGKYITVLQRTDGKWLIVRDTWNSDRAPAAAPAPAEPSKS